MNNGEESDDDLFLLTQYLTVSSVILQAKLLLLEQFEGCCVGRSPVPRARGVLCLVVLREKREMLQQVGVDEDRNVRSRCKRSTLTVEQ